MTIRFLLLLPLAVAGLAVRGAGGNDAIAILAATEPGLPDHWK